MFTVVCSTARRTTRRFVVLATATTLGLPALAALQPPAPPAPGVGSVTMRPVAADVNPSMVTLDVPSLPRRTADASPRTLMRTARTAEPVVAKLPRTPTKDFGVVGVTWSSGVPVDGLSVQVKAHVDGAWSSWQDLDVHADEQPTGPSARGGTNPTWVGEADGIAVRLLSADGQVPEDVEVATIDGGTGLAGPALEPVAATTSAEGVTAMPPIVTREEWGVDTRKEVSCSEPRTARNMKGVVLHHTAGSNDYSPEEAPGIVRGIHLYHTQARGWCDIGYNFLVDKYGTIYEGRRGGIYEQVRGAHAGNWDVNLYTTGISMMGNFEEVPVPEPMKAAVVDLAAWRFSLFGHKARGWIKFGDHRLKRLSGHRDVALAGIRPATSTACPGKYAYEWLNSGLRLQVQARIDAVTEDTETPPPPTTPPPPPPPTTSRMAGDNRFATAAAISAQSFPTPGGTVFLASGESFPDALSGGPAAAGKAGPVLLTRTDALPPETVAELQRLAPKRVFILGGRAAVSREVARQARQYAETVRRLSGANRYATGVAVSERFWPSSSVVYVASGEAYPDALSGGTLAAHDGAPILLSRPDRLPDAVAAELTRLNPSRVVLLGGTGALTDEVQTGVEATLPSAAVQRLGGSNRFETSARIAAAGWTDSQAVYFAAGMNFPDALAGVPAAAMEDAPLLLTRKTCMPPDVYDTTTRMAPVDKVLLGGSAVLEKEALETRCDAAAPVT